MNNQTNQTFEQDYLDGLKKLKNSNPNQNLVDAFAQMAEAEKDYMEHNKKVGR